MSPPLMSHLVSHDGLDLIDKVIGPRYARYRNAALVLAAALLVIPLGLIASQPDLGTALMIAGCGVMVMFLAGVLVPLDEFPSWLQHGRLPAPPAPIGPRRPPAAWPTAEMAASS